MNPIDYKQAGVDYASIDPLKVRAQQAAAATAGHLARHGLAEVAASRGESAYVIDCGDFYLASITECLGTKALVADAMRSVSGRTFYDLIAQDTLAMAINDIITVGATPISVHAYWASGGSDWFADAERARDLVDGWRAACDRCGVAWGGGETPALAGVVEPGRIDLAASCVGLVRPKTRLTLGERLADGDAIVLLGSSGIHANGVSLARKLAERLPDAYRTRLADGTLYGEALLAPTTLYAPVTEALAAAGITPHYCANITGHGWRKLMTLERQRQFVARDTGAVVGHDDATDATAIEAHLDVACAGVKTVFQQFLDDRSRPLDYFSGRDLTDQCVVEKADAGSWGGIHRGAL